MLRITFGSLLAVLALGACTDSDDYDYPVEPGTELPPGSGTTSTRVSRCPKARSTRSPG